MLKKHKKDWGMGHDEDSRTRPGEKDYTGHPGDESHEKEGEEDYTWRKDHKSKTHSGKDDTGHEGDKSKTHPGHIDYREDELYDFLAKEARDGKHMKELLDDHGWELRKKDDHKEATDDDIEKELGVHRDSKPRHVSVVRLRVARNNLKKDK